MAHLSTVYQYCTVGIKTNGTDLNGHSWIYSRTCKTKSTLVTLEESQNEIFEELKLAFMFNFAWLAPCSLIETLFFYLLFIYDSNTICLDSMSGFCLVPNGGSLRECIVHPITSQEPDYNPLQICFF